MKRLTICVMAICAAAALRADLSTVKAETNLEKRARLALSDAGEELTLARNDYERGDAKGTEALFAEMRELVEIAQTALSETRKNPVRSPKQFKHAELKSRELLKRMESFEQSMDFSDRKMIESTKMKIQEIHDEWLLGIMGTKK